MPPFVRVPCCGGALLLASWVAAATVQAQSRRDSLVAQADTEFNPDRRIQLLITALDPALGSPQDSAWAVAVQSLAQTLRGDKHQDSLAAVWLRWAIRQAPALQPDADRFEPLTVAAFRAAREFVNETHSTTDDLTQTRWTWSQATAAGPGRLQVQSAQQVPLQAFVARSGAVALGVPVPLASGSYDVRAAASGYDSARVTREVLPGVTTVVELRLRATVAHVAPSTLPQSAIVPKKKGFPVVLALVGVAGAGAIVAALAGHGGGNGNNGGGGGTGGIIVNFPP